MLKMNCRVLALILFVVITGCGYQSEIHFTNKGQERIDNVKVFVIEQLVWEGVLDVGESANVDFNVNKDGVIEIIGEYKGRMFSTGKLGYVTPNDKVSHKIVFKDIDLISYDYSGIQ